MARDPKNKPESKPTKPRFNDVQFVNWSLSFEQKQDCKNFLVTEGDHDEALLTIIQAGYKVTVSYDNYRDCFTASIVPTQDAKSNQGFILTGKGSTPLKAARQVLYIHYRIMDEDWSAYSTAKSVEELDD
jgi:hypothetical protein